MTFTLTPAYLDSLLSPMRKGDLSALFGAMDPACELRMGASDQAGEGGAGVYVSRAWVSTKYQWDVTRY